MCEKQRSLSDIPAFAQVEAVEMIKGIINEAVSGMVLVEDIPNHVQLSTLVIRTAMLTLFEPVSNVNSAINTNIHICGVDGLYQAKDYAIKPMPRI